MTDALPLFMSKSRALSNEQMNKLLQCCLSPSGLMPLDHCAFLAFYSCKDIAMGHQHAIITGKIHLLN